MIRRLSRAFWGTRSSQITRGDLPSRSSQRIRVSYLACYAACFHTAHAPSAVSTSPPIDEKYVLEGQLALALASVALLNTLAFIAIVRGHDTGLVL